MAANNIYYPGLPLRTQYGPIEHYLLLDQKEDGTPFKISIVNFLETAKKYGWAVGAFNNLSDTPDTLGEPGQIPQVNEAGDALEFVDINDKAKCFMLAMSIVL